MRTFSNTVHKIQQWLIFISLTLFKHQLAVKIFKNLLTHVSNLQIDGDLVLSRIEQKSQYKMQTQ